MPYKTCFESQPLGHKTSPSCITHAANGSFTDGTHRSPAVAHAGHGSPEHARPSVVYGPSAFAFGISMGGTLACATQGASSMTGDEMLIDATQGLPPQRIPSAIAVFDAHDPSHPAGGSKFVQTSLPMHADEPTVHVVGGLHAPTGASHEHAGHVGSTPGAELPSNVTFGADAGQSGKTTMAPDASTTGSQPSGSAAHVPFVHAEDAPSAASPASGSIRNSAHHPGRP